MNLAPANPLEDVDASVHEMAMSCIRMSRQDYDPPMISSHCQVY